MCNRTHAVLLLHACRVGVTVSGSAPNVVTIMLVMLQGHGFEVKQTACLVKATLIIHTSLTLCCLLQAFRNDLKMLPLVTEGIVRTAVQGRCP